MAIFDASAHGTCPFHRHRKFHGIWPTLEHGSVIDSILMPTLATVEYRAAFISTSELLRVESHLFPATFRTRLRNHSTFLNVIFCQGLHCRSLGAKDGWESAGFGYGGNGGFSGVLSYCISVAYAQTFFIFLSA